jgi:hypothetical protein
MTRLRRLRRRLAALARESWVLHAYSTGRRTCPEPTHHGCPGVHAATGTGAGR